MRVFKTISLLCKNKIPNTNGSYKDYFKKKDKDGNLLINSLFLSPTNSSEIEKIINSIDANKSTGPNSIPVFILKSLKPFFSFWLTRLISLSFEVSIFPDLKTAKIAYIHKKGSKLNEENYRPISQLSTLSKIYEKVLYVRLYSHLIKNKLVYDKQYGF